MKSKTITGKLSQKGVVCINKEIMKMLGVNPGDRLEFSKSGTDVIVNVIKRKSIMNAFGSLKLDESLKSIKEIEDEIIR